MSLRAIARSTTGEPRRHQREGHMRTLVVATVFSVCAVASMAAQFNTNSSDVVGTWKGPAGCQHGDGETITLIITRDSAGKLQGATDWARSTSDRKSVV